MNLKFLPVGSVCKISNDNNYLLIVGYKQNSYDYVAVNYPEGIGANNFLKYFNHDDIKDLLSLGYKNETWINYNENILLPELGANTLVVEGFQFDENGIVISDEIVTESITPSMKYDFNESTVVVDNSDSVSNLGLQFDASGIVIADSSSSVMPVDSIINTQQTGEYQFDENGIVINDKIVTESNAPSMKYDFDENGVVTGDWTTSPSPEKSKYRYDENGIIIGEETLPDVGVQSYQFDENGIVTGDWTTSPSPEKPNYVYDENGVIVSDGMGVFNQPKLDLQFNENGVVISDGQNVLDTMIVPAQAEENRNVVELEEEADIQFDENGMVVINEELSILDNLESTEAIEVVEEPKKEEKKKRSFFGFGK